MTPEERAAIVVDKLLQDGEWSETDYVELVAQAIRDTKREAYREAAREIANHSAALRGNLVLLDSQPEVDGKRHDTMVAMILEVDHVETSVRALTNTLCAHAWIDARNEVVANGEYCSKCGLIRMKDSVVASPVSSKASPQQST